MEEKMGKIKIAIVNDNYRKIEVLGSVLYQEGIEYEVFYTVETFLDYILNNPHYFDGIFLDMELPEKEGEKILKGELGGEKILKELQKSKIEIPFIIYSTYRISEEKKKSELYKNMHGQIAWIVSSNQYQVLEFLESIIKS